MKPINLAEAKILERSYCKEQINRRLRIMALWIVLMLLAAAISSAGKMTVTGKATHLKSDLADMQARATVIKKNLATIKVRSSQREWQKQLASGSKRWLDILDSILSRVPENVWLSRIETVQQGGTVEVEGSAPSFEAVSTFISRLRDSRRFTEVILNSTKVSMLGKLAVVDFSVQVKLKNAGPATVPNAAPSTPNQAPVVQESP